ncbi:MAG: IS4 family transposase [Candidatus Aminicenantes bacterium]|nr:IS4 family transposase [Candidatus Aminicenantes bacterium]NIM83840.1 IS4 family transposase [Candidatus Aminicenantes bacterium]NIN23304.1 IS4 family transposase [Candidatus Aminicenantes bacterium]NIN47008.1 IS4 family transposase [Candidatus Aminicenantes bacterium]NIN89930.1 IS4 family transposase [Candidatus Aminicenantes bacterium]
MNKSYLKDDWCVIESFLPNNWEKKAYELGAIVRERKITTPHQLLRLLFIHLATGKSLRTSAAYARETNLCHINDTSLLRRLRSASEWLRWMAFELFKLFPQCHLPEQFTGKYRIRVVDGTVISEPGSSGTDWRIHYSITLKTLRCDHFLITGPEIGESLQKYPVLPNDFFIGDRNYCQRKGIVHVLQNKGQVLVRFHSNNVPLLKRNGKPFPVLKHLRECHGDKIGDWDVWFRHPEDNQQLIKGRLCAIRKSETAIELAKQKLIKNAKKKGYKLRPKTLVHAEYVTIFTTVNRHNFKADELLSLYRDRWQIELVFKRLKSILKISQLPKEEGESCIAWLHGKMLVALLAERLYQEAEFFSPWGYPLYGMLRGACQGKEDQTGSQYMA